CLAKTPQDRPRLDELLVHLTRLAKETPVSPSRPKRNDVGLAQTMALTPTPAVPPRGLADLLPSHSNPAGNTLPQAPLNQLCAVIGDVAGALAADDERLAHCAEEVQQLHDEITNVEVELTLMESQLAEAPVAERVALQRKRAQVLAQSAGLRQRLDTKQTELARLVEQARASASAEVTGLYDELDQLA